MTDERGQLMPPTFPQPLVHAIGMVAMEAATLERGAASFLWGTHQGNQVTARREGPDQFGAIVRALQDVRKKELAGDINSGLNELFKAWLSDAKNLMDQRNHVIHAMWGAFPDERGKYRCVPLRRLGGEAKPPVLWLSLDELEAIALRIRDHNLARNRLVGPMTRAIPSLRRHIRHASEMPTEPPKPWNVIGRVGEGLR